MCVQNRSNPHQKCCGACRKRAAQPEAPAAPAPEPIEPESFLQSRPWIWIVVAWIFIVSAMSVVVTIAVRNSPESIPLPTHQSHGH